MSNSRFFKDMTVYLPMLGEDPDAVQTFVSQKYANGWIMEWSINNNGEETRLFVDDNGISYKVLYKPNDKHVYVPVRLISIEFPPAPNFDL